MPPEDEATQPMDAAQDQLRRILEAGVAHPLGGLLKRMEQQTTAVPERAMRRTLALERLLSLDDVELVGFLALILQRIGEGHSASRQVLQELALAPSLFQELPYERVEAAYSLAQAAELGGVARMFLGSALEAGLEDGRPGIDNQHLDLPLGTRTSAARGRDRFKLDRLLHDRNPKVIAALLDNPRLIERDVVKIAAMRPTRGEVLEVVAAHARWAARYRVRKALACNPHTPAPIARRLLPTLMVQDLVLALEAGVFPADLRPEVLALVRQRREAARASSRVDVEPS